MKNCSISGTIQNKQEGIFMSGIKTACITGVSGQDAAYLAKYLLELGYKVVGTRRRTSTDNLWRLRVLDIIDHKNLEIVEADITDLGSLIKVFREHKPHEVYNLAAMSHVGTSFNQPKLTWDVTAQGAMNVVDAAILCDPKTRVYQASTSEMMGSHFEVVDGEKIQNENTKMDGNSPYGAAKFAAHNYIRVLRESGDNYACCGILYNHGSPLRGENFFERKVTKYIGELLKWIEETLCAETDDFLFTEEHIRCGDSEFPKLRLGDLSTYRDMGHSADYVRAMHLMLQRDSPKDYIICSGKTHQMKDIVRIAFEYIGLDWEKFVFIDPQFFRPREVEYLRGDCSRAKEELNWELTYSLEEMIHEMIDHDIEWAKENRNYG